MIFYIEKRISHTEIIKKLLHKYKDADFLYIDNYKNIFDNNISFKLRNTFIYWTVNNAISKAPLWYWHKWGGFFLKNSLNCIYDCKYCYLKWAFKNSTPVFL